jgi:hypothetical protein
MLIGAEVAVYSEIKQNKHSVGIKYSYQMLNLLVNHVANK